MAPQRYHDQWEHLFSQKQQDFLESDCRVAPTISDFDDLQVALHDLTTSYRAGTFPDLISRLNPSLDHVRSFTNAISSASQSNPKATLIWGAIQAVMETACQNNYAVDEMVDTVAQLNKDLPPLEPYIDLLTNSSALQFKLQHLYDTYIDYCIACVQYMKRSSVANFLSYFFYSSPQRNLAKTKDMLRIQFRQFREAVERIELSSKQHRDIQQVLASPPLSQIPIASTSDGSDDINFPISTVSLYRNYTFLGRDEILSKMHVKLSPNSTSTTNRPTSKHGQQPACCILHGLGGVGKTQVALEYTYRRRDEYDAVFWINSDQEHSLAATLSLIAEKLDIAGDLEDHDGQSQSRAVRRATDWLRTTKRSWLIVFDNVENIDDLLPYFPRDIQSENGGVIITTQKPDLFPITEPEKTMTQPIQNLSRDEGARLIFKYLEKPASDEDEEEIARQISDLLDGLPLALATIGGYINQSGDTVSNYFDNLKTSSKAWTASAIGPVKQYEKRLETVFDMALAELSEGPRCLINILAFLNPDSIPEEMFTSNIGKSHVPFIASQAELVDMIRMLRKRQLIRRDTHSGKRPFLSVHRTVQWSVLLNLSVDYDHRWRVFRQAFDIVQECLPIVSRIDYPEPKYWKQFEKFVPQILSLRSHCLWPEPPVELPRDFAQVLSDMATYMWHAGLFTEGTQALLTAEDILDDNDIGKKDPLRGNIHAHLGIFASFNGVSERKYALERREKAIEARKASHNQISKEKLTREDEIRRWNVESDMAYGQIHWEDFEGAAVTVGKCLEQYQKWGTEDEIPFEYVKYHQIMTYICLYRQQPVDAVKHAKKGTLLAEKCASLMHPTSQLLRFTLTNCLYLTGELDEALTLAEAVLEARRRIHGEFNHYVLETYSFCASLLAEKGRHDEAEQMYLKCLDRRKRVTWNQEGVARAQFLYGKTLRELGREDEAKSETESAKKTVQYYLEQYPEWLTPNDDEMVVLDQMVSLWAGRYTGKLKQQ